MFNVALAHHDYFLDTVCVIETKLDFVSFDNKNLQRQQKFAGQRDFHIQNSYTGQIQCQSHSRDQKFVTSLVHSAND